MNSENISKMEIKKINDGDMQVVMDKNWLRLRVQDCEKQGSGDFAFSSLINASNVHEINSQASCRGVRGLLPTHTHTKESEDY